MKDQNLILATARKLTCTTTDLNGFAGMLLEEKCDYSAFPKNNVISFKYDGNTEILETLRQMDKDGFKNLKVAETISVSFE